MRTPPRQAAGFFFLCVSGLFPVSYVCAPTRAGWNIGGEKPRKDGDAHDTKIAKEKDKGGKQRKRVSRERPRPS